MLPQLAVTLSLALGACAQVETCPQDILILKDLPGYGWDNLENSVRLSVFTNDYSSCHITQDKLFRIPGNIFIHNKRDSNIEFTSKAFTSSHEYESATAKGINAEGGGGAFGYSVSASFSYEHKTNKKQQKDSKSVTLRNEYRYKLFTAIVDPYSQVSDILKKRVATIGDLYQTDSFRANFMIEEIVRDYGTHLITSVDFGAIMFQDDKIDRMDFYKHEGQGDSYTFGLKVTTPFASGSIGGHYNTTKSKNESYAKSKRGSAISTHGGKVQGGLNVTDWLQSVPTKAVPIDRNGIPIENIFNELNFPDVLPETLMKIRKKTEDVVSKYYDVNSHHGCMDPRSPHYDYKANINDDSCGLPRTDHAFGGFFQEGETFSGSVYKANPLTGGYSCPKGYNPKKLYEHTETHCSRHCSGTWFWRKCWEECPTKTLSSSWCYSDTKDPESGWALGGFHGAMRAIPQTGKQGCPSGYKEDAFFPFSLCWQVFNENTRGDALRFGGVFSCEADNPYGGGQGCPANYSKILITVAEPRCAVYYCVQLVEASATPGLIRVPFKEQKVKSTNLTPARKRMRTEQEINSSWVTILGGGGACAFVVLLIAAGVIYKTFKQRKKMAGAYSTMSMDQDTEGTSLLRSGEAMSEEDTLRRRSLGGGV